MGLEKVKCITKGVVRNGEIVRDAQIFIPRHESHPMTERTEKLFAHDSTLKARNEDLSLFEEGVQFEECVEQLHSQIQEI